MRGGRPAPRLFHVFRASLQAKKARWQSPPQLSVDIPACMPRKGVTRHRNHSSNEHSTFILRHKQDLDSQQKNSRAGKHEVRRTRRLPIHPASSTKQSAESSEYAPGRQGKAAKKHTQRQPGTKQSRPPGKTPKRPAEKEQATETNVLFVGGNAAPFFWVGGPCSLQVLMAMPPPSLWVGGPCFGGFEPL